MCFFRAFFGGCISSCAIASCVVCVSDRDFAERFLLIREAFVLVFKLFGCLRSFCSLLFPRVTRDSSLFLFFGPADGFVVCLGWVQSEATEPPGVMLLAFIKAEAILRLSMWCVTMWWSYIDLEICTPLERRYIERRVNTLQSLPLSTRDRAGHGVRGSLLHITLLQHTRQRHIRRFWTQGHFTWSTKHSSWGSTGVQLPRGE